MSDPISSIRLMGVRQLIPEGLADMAPGPELAALLSGIDIGSLNGSDVVETLRGAGPAAVS